MNVYSEQGLPRTMQTNLNGRRVENVKKTYSAGEQVGRVKGWAL